MTTTKILIKAIQELSAAHDLATIQRIVRVAARELTGADGATFVLKDADECFYADEDAISPLWKGKRFPLAACISGWTMVHRQPAIIPDIYADDRIPHDAYRPTFVKSLVMVPIRSEDPIGAIGNYWATPRIAESSDVEALQALADSTSTALANVELLATLDRRVRERTVQLEHANQELQSFSYSVSHDLRAPLRAIQGFTTILVEDHKADLKPEAAQLLARVTANAERMNELIDDFLDLARISAAPLCASAVDLAELTREVASELAEENRGHRVTLQAPQHLEVRGDAGLLRILLRNLLSNAWKFTRGRADPRVALELETTADGATYSIVDNGVGFDPSRTAQLFTPFTRLHSRAEFEGTGIGLATCRRVVSRHGGSISATSQPGAGVRVSFTLP